MADEEDNIRPQVAFADGTFGFIKTILANIVGKDLKGVEKMYHDFVLTPTPRTIKRWKLKDKTHQDFQDKEPYAGFYIKRYPVELCQVLDPGPKSVWFLHCDWEAKPIDIFKGQVTLWRNLLNTRETELQSSNNIIKRLRYKLRMQSKNSMLDIQNDADNLKKIGDTLNTPVFVTQSGQPNAGTGDQH